MCTVKVCVYSKRSWNKIVLILTDSVVVEMAVMYENSTSLAVVLTQMSFILKVSPPILKA